MHVQIIIIIILIIIIVENNNINTRRAVPMFAVTIMPAIYIELASH